MDLITLTDKAGAQLKSIMASQKKEGYGLRVTVAGGGCSGLQYKMGLEENPQASDRIFESSGIRVFIDPKSALYLAGTQIDYEESLMGGGFKFSNPKATGGCGCGKSFSA